MGVSAAYENNPEVCKGLVGPRRGTLLHICMSELTSRSAPKNHHSSLVYG